MNTGGQDGDGRTTVGVRRSILRELQLVAVDMSADSRERITPGEAIGRLIRAYRERHPQKNAG